MRVSRVTCLIHPYLTVPDLHFGQDSSTPMGRLVGICVVMQTCIVTTGILSRLAMAKAWVGHAGGQTCISHSSKQMLKLLTHPEPHSFTFDAVAAEDVDQEGIFQGGPCLSSLLSGWIQAHSAQMSGLSAPSADFPILASSGVKCFNLLQNAIPAYRRLEQTT